MLHKVASVAHRPRLSCHVLGPVKVAVVRVRGASAKQTQTLRRQSRTNAVETDSTSGSVQTISGRIVELEQELQDLYAPGKRAPRAAVVARIRNEITLLTQKLETIVGSGEMEVSEGASVGQSLAMRAFEEVENALKTKLKPRNKALDEEILKLEAENSRLRTQAKGLLYRQQQLEELLASARSTVQVTA